MEEGNKGQKKAGLVRKEGRREKKHGGIQKVTEEGQNL